MSVSDGEKGDASTFNGAFLSRDSDSDTIGVVGLVNTDPDSGPPIDNLQESVNGGITAEYGTQLIPNGGTVNLDQVIGNQLRPVQGDGGAVVASSTPLGTTAPNNGTCFILVGLSDTDTVRFNSNDAAYGFLINGPAILSRGCVLKVRYMASLNRYIEEGRNF